MKTETERNAVLQTLLGSTQELRDAHRGYLRQMQEAQRSLRRMRWFVTFAMLVSLLSLLLRT